MLAHSLFIRGTAMNRISLVIFVAVVIAAAIFFIPKNTSAQATCKADAKFVVRGPNSELVENINWELYKQDFDSDNRPILGKIVIRGTTGDKGAAAHSFDPSRFTSESGEDLFALKIYELNKTAGAFIFWNFPINCGSVFEKTVKLSRLKLVARDVAGTSLKDRKWELYTQKRDIDNRPIIDEMVSTRLTTGSRGVTYAYVKPGMYKVFIPASGNLQYEISDVEVNSERLRSLEHTLSSFRFIAHNLVFENAINVKVNVWSQTYDLSNQPVADVQVSSATVGEEGFVDLFVPAGLYALNVDSDWEFNVKVAFNQVTEVRLVQDVDEVRFDTISEPRGTPTRANNTLIRSSAVGRVYVLKNGLKHYIPSPSIFAAHGYNWGNVITISLTELESYVEGPPLTLPEHYKSLDDGDLVKAPNVAAVYLIENGMKRVFVSGGAFTSRGYKWSDIITVDTLLISQHPDGEPLTETVVTEGSLVKSVSSPVVYLIQNGSKRPFTDERSFLTRGYNWYDIRGVSFSELDAVPLGSPMEYEFDDFDQDGLNAADESQYGTDPNEEDTDGDGYLDGQEVYNGYNPLGTGLL